MSWVMGDTPVPASGTTNGELNVLLTSVRLPERLLAEVGAKLTMKVAELPGATESGSVSPEKLKPVPTSDAWVTLRSRGGVVRGQLEQGSSVLTSAEGVFSFSSLIPGEYELQAASSRGASALMNVKSGSSSVLLQLSSQVPPGGQASNDRR